MKDVCRLHISFEPTFGNVDVVRAAVRGGCTMFFQVDDTALNIMDFCLIVAELLNNAVEHSNAQMLETELTLSDGDAVFELVYVGDRFDPTVMAKMPMTEENGEIAEGGYGLPLIQTLADDMQYEYRENKNMVTLWKAFSGSGKDRDYGNKARNGQ